MNYERAPEYKMSYEDRLTEEAWAIARTRKMLESEGRKWEPWTVNVVTIKFADLLSGKTPELQIDVPDETDYQHARKRVDGRIEYSRYSYERIKRAGNVFVPLHQNWYGDRPDYTTLNSSWNGQRDPLSVDEYFFMAGIPEEELKTVFRFDPENAPDPVRVFGGFFGFVEGGRQRLTDLVGRPLTFIQMRDTRWGINQWDLSSREIFNPSMIEGVEI